MEKVAPRWVMWISFISLILMGLLMMSGSLMEIFRSAHLGVWINFGYLLGAILMVYFLAYVPARTIQVSLSKKPKKRK